MTLRALYTSGKPHHPGAFTLIELLIVVAIIAILAAIAVPNFLEAQVRSKVTRCKADMRTLRTALETYRIDHGRYAPDLSGYDVETWTQLTTPIAYVSSILVNPFPARNYLTPPALPTVYIYGANTRLDGPNGPFRNGWPDNMRQVGLEYWFLSAGPNTYLNLQDYGGWGDDGGVWFQLDQGTGYLQILYDPTNGTKSSGDIIVSNKRIYN